MLSIVPNHKYSIIQNQYIHKTINFKSLERDVKDADGKIKYRNNTNFFRSDLNWNRVISRIIKKSPEKIYCYACSDGSEAYSIALGLIGKLGYENAQKHFPVIAKDIDETMINQANSGIISITDNDLHKIQKALGKNGKVSEYFTKIDGTEKIEKNVNIGIPMETEESVASYKVTDKLKKCVKFQVGDIIKDSKNPDLYNSAIFLRNVWPYFTHKAMDTLLDNIKTNITDKTTLIIGDFDIQSFAFKFDDKLHFQDMLWKSSLKPIYPLIYEKHNFENAPICSKELFKFIAHSFTDMYFNSYEYFRRYINN